jgi:hypothetical protein
MTPQELQPILQTIFTRLKALEDAIQQLKKDMNK